MLSLESTEDINQAKNRDLKLELELELELLRQHVRGHFAVLPVISSKCNRGRRFDEGGSRGKKCTKRTRRAHSQKPLTADHPSARQGERG